MVNPCTLQSKDDPVGMIGRVQAELEELILKFQLARAHELYLKYEQALIPALYWARRKERIARRWQSIRYDLREVDFKNADELFRVSLEVLLDQERDALRTRFEEGIRDSARKHLEGVVIPLLKRYAFDEARNAFAVLGIHGDPGQFQALDAKYRTEQAASNASREIEQLLETWQFKDAQELLRSNPSLSSEQFARKMGRHVEKYFATQTGFRIDRDKGIALSTTARRTLVEARAGSGKSALLACFVRLLVEKMGVSPDEVLLMAFNKNAADAIGIKIRTEHRVPEFRNARTFHSLAWHLSPAAQKGSVLTDDVDREAWEGSRQKYLEELWKALRKRHKRLWLLALLMFRKEMAPREAEFDPDSEEYYLYRRNECERSLRGEMVKSRGEKCIADFLLEHDIRYSYERTYFLGADRLYRPDFTLFVDGRQLILEHWAIDPSDPMAQIPVTWSKTTQQYRAEIREKRAYWHERDVALLETNATQLRNGRESFETALKTLLEQHSLRCSRLTLEEISARISDSATRKLVELFSQLISRAKKSDLSPEAVRLAYRTQTKGDPRTRAFGSLAWRVYEAYEQQMKIDGCTDYDTLLSTATARVDNAVGDLVVDDKNRGAFNLSATKWLLVDEYQDFSQLFGRLLESLLAFNRSLRLLCVGDNWQAINGFAGSEVRFIEDFELLSPEPDVLRLPLPVNRRSRERIVAAGNRLMRGEAGQPAIALQDNVGGKVTKRYVDDVFVDLRASDPKDEGANPDARYIVRSGAEDSRAPDALASKYLKLVAEIIGADPTKSYSVLARTNRVSSIKLTDFATRLRECLGAEFLRRMQKGGKRVDVSTVHSYKGGESDVSIVLRVTTRQFPLIHPDSALLAPIGETLARVISEERRLFYVAISRAKEELVLVTEKERESDFLSGIFGSAA